MPIRINLLAEQQAAEEARRRDPVKRAIYICSALVAGMLCWGGLLQMNVRSARRELDSYENNLLRLEEKAKQAKADKQLDAEITKRLASLERYTQSRFYWGNVMNAMQHIPVDNVRFTDFSSDQRYLANAENKVKTNLVFAIAPQPAGWKFWAKPPPSTNALTIVSNLVTVLTNRPPFSTNKVPVTVKITDLTTNMDSFEVTAKLEVVTPVTTSEEITLLIEARDYSNPVGAQVLELQRSITRQPYFKALLSQVEGQAVVLREGGFKSENDPMDPFNPAANFTRFQLECNFEKRVLANE